MKTAVVAVLSLLLPMQGSVVHPLARGESQWAMADGFETQEFQVLLDDETEGAYVTIQCHNGIGLEVYLVDENGEIIASDTEPQETMTLWVPAGSGEITVRVVNTTDDFNMFTLSVE